MRIPYSLTEAEIEINRRGLEDPNLWADYWYRPVGAEHGWQFDGNFTAEGAWQLDFTLAAQSNIIISGGVGCGKTVGVGAAAGYFAAEVHPDFKFLNAGPSSNQASMMHQEILKLTTGTPFEKLIWSFRNRPYPQIVIKFYVRKTLVTSTLEFMSVDKNAKNIFSYEGDWINIEEGGLLDDLEEVLISLGTRLRGSYRGRARMGRLSIISNPWDNNYFWYLFDLAEGDPENYLSMMVSTKANRNITEKQLELIKKRLPPEERERFIDGERPQGRGNFFNKARINDCEDHVWAEEIMAKAKKGVAGYVIQKDPGVGLAFFTTPAQKGHQYMMFGDPGTESAPNRNAPAVFVFDVTDFPEKRADLCAFWWGNGGGSIRPFVYRLVKWAQEYRPTKVGVDSTGTQKYSAELLNTFAHSSQEDPFGWVGDEEGMRLPEGIRITGLDFSGPKKISYLRSAAFLIESVMFRWPSFLSGLHSQLSNYDYLKDSMRKGGIPQDLVSVLSMAAYTIRRYFYVEIDAETLSEGSEGDDTDLGRARRSDRSARTLRNPMARPGTVSASHSESSQGTNQRRGR